MTFRPVLVPLLLVCGKRGWLQISFVSPLPCGGTHRVYGRGMRVPSSCPVFIGTKRRFFFGGDSSSFLSSRTFSVGPDEPAPHPGMTRSLRSSKGLLGKSRVRDTCSRLLWGRGRRQRWRALARARRLVPSLGNLSLGQGEVQHSSGLLCSSHSLSHFLCGSLNVRTGSCLERREEIGKTARDHNLSVLMIQESKMRGRVQGRVLKESGVSFRFWGSAGVKGQCGVGIFIREGIGLVAVDEYTENPRMVMVRCTQRHGPPLTFISAYAPTEVAEREEKELFYHQLATLIRKFRKDV